MKFRYALALLPLALAACDEQAMKDFRMPWDKPLDATPAAAAPAQPVDPMKVPLVAPEVAPTQVPIEVAGDHIAVATAEGTTLSVTAYNAHGNEPFWRVDVTGGSARYQTPDNQAGSKIAVKRIVYQSGVEYIGEYGGAPFSLNIRSGECNDGMSDEKFPMTATLRVGSKHLRGCARPAAAAPATAETAPAAKPRQG